MHPFFKYLIWGIIALFLITHPTVIAYVFHQLGTFAATMKQGGY